MPKMTLATKLVLGVLLDDISNHGGMYGREISEKTALPSGTVQPILARLEDAEWATSSWERGWEPGSGRPRRRYWRLTAVGASVASGAGRPS